MKVTKFAQSCILIESLGEKILIDPGSLLPSESTLKVWKEADAILITHKHFDHFDEESVRKLVMNKPSLRVYATKETASYYPNTKFEIIKEGNVLSCGEIKVEAVHAVHGYLPQLKNGKEANEAVGFIIDDGKKRLYHTGDTICFKNDYKCNIIMLPMNNHGVVMGPFEAALYAKETGAELVLPIHFDNPALPIDMKRAEEELKKNNLKYKILKIGESVEV
ncbi:MAG: MBL fold metallo-hydrolase [Candidatus Diapherotrites archaeon]|nr:MBL fold metallo-hydrolase [Candidatus Diapherotrites archaeon]